MITSADEDLHAPGDSPHWQESFYFNWTSPDGRDFGFTRLGFNPATGKADAVLILLRDGVPEVVYAKVGQAVRAHADGSGVATGLSVAGLTFTMKDALDTWRIQLSGRTEVDLTWSAFTPAFDFHTSFPGDAELAQAHFEQSGRVTGIVRVGGSERTVDGLGQRDKSWGVRDWNGLVGWDWLVGQFGPDLAFNATRTDVGGELASCGYVFHHGAPDAVLDMSVDYGWRTQHQPDTAVITVRCASGETFTIHARRVGGRCPLVKKGLFIEEKALRDSR